jgi:glycosyltransferase involved in cell wall biosynthesis
MRVGLDMSPALSSNSGVGRYAVELYRGLQPLPDIDVKAFAVGHRRSTLPMRRIPVPLRAMAPWWRIAKWPRAETIVGGADIVHSVDLVLAPTRKPLVMTIHDVLPITHPQFFPERQIAHVRRRVEAARHADVVISTCSATADETARVVGIARDRVVVATPGWRHGDVPAEAPPPPPVAPGYVLAVGTVTPRKGFDTLAAGAALLGPSCPPVVIAGPDLWHADEVRARVAAADTYRRVSFLGRVDDSTLESLYAHATVVVHASVAEGVGIPVLEAMGLGAPVIAADIPSVREVAGGHAALVPPGDAVALGDALGALLADSDRRRAMSEAGRARAREFTWAGMAERIASAYRQMM